MPPFSFYPLASRVGGAEQRSRKSFGASSSPGRIILDTSKGYEFGYLGRSGISTMDTCLSLAFTKYIKHVRDKRGVAAATDSIREEIFIFTSIPDCYLCTAWPAL